MTANGRPGTGSAPFLDADERSTLVALVERIFPPGDGGPGASELGVPAFIDSQLASPWGRGDLTYAAGPFRVPDHGGHGWQSPLAPRDVYRQGLAALDRYCRTRFGGPLAALGAADQDAAVAALRADEVDPAPPPGVPSFFSLCRENVLEGLYSDPRHGGNAGGAGWDWVGYLGAKGGR